MIHYNLSVPLPFLSPSTRMNKEIVLQYPDIIQAGHPLAFSLLLMGDNASPLDGEIFRVRQLGQTVTSLFLDKLTWMQLKWLLCSVLLKKIKCVSVYWNQSGIIQFPWKYEVEKYESDYWTFHLFCRYHFSLTTLFPSLLSHYHIETFFMFTNCIGKNPELLCTLTEVLNGTKKKKKILRIWVLKLLSCYSIEQNVLLLYSYMKTW